MVDTRKRSGLSGPGRRGGGFPVCLDTPERPTAKSTHAVPLPLPRGPVGPGLLPGPGC